MSSEIIYKKDFEKYIKKMKDKHLKSKFKETIEQIQLDPYGGYEKTGDLTGFFTWTFNHNKNKYLIGYKPYIDEKGNLIIIVTAGTRENFYNKFKRLIKHIE